MPRRRSTETPEERDRRRELQRGYEKASYHRKKEAIAGLKAEVESLQREFDELSARRVVVEEDDGNLLLDTHTDTESDDHGTGPEAAQRRKKAALRRLLRIKKSIEELQKENSQLQSEVDERAQLEAHLKELLDEHLAVLPTEHSCAYISLPHSEYSEIIAKSQDHAMRFFYDDAKLSTGASVFGWRDYRKPIGDGTFDYALEKEFSHISAAEMERRTWKLLSSSNSNVQLCDIAMNPRFYLLEKINENTCLFHALMDPMPGIMMKSLYLLSRIPIDGGCLIVWSHVEPDRIFFCESELFDDLSAAGSTASMWHKDNTWAIIKETGPDRTLFHFGGTGHMLFMLEVLLLVLRWNTNVVGPLMALPTSAANESKR